MSVDETTAGRWRIVFPAWVIWLVGIVCLAFVVTLMLMQASEWHPDPRLAHWKPAEPQLNLSWNAIPPDPTNDDAQLAWIPADNEMLLERARIVDKDPNNAKFAISYARTPRAGAASAGSLRSTCHQFQFLSHVSRYLAAVARVDAHDSTLDLIVLEETVPRWEKGQPVLGLAFTARLP